jgi:hypothetical protein
MKVIWLNDGEPDDNGDYVAQIVNGKGNPISTFKGKTYKEVADQALKGQLNANRIIAGMRKPDKGVKPIKAEPKELTADDKFRLASEITDPNKVVDAVTEIVSAKQGLTPEKLGEVVSTTATRQSDDFYREEANAFIAATPDYYPVPQNRDKIFQILKINGWDLTRNNLAIAFQALSEQGEMIPWPSNAGPEEEDDDEENGNPSPTPQRPNGTAPVAATPVNASAPRPRSISTGFRSSDASSLPPAPPKKPKYTRADIERMSRAEFNQKLMTEPDFRKQVDAMGA